MSKSAFSDAHQLLISALADARRDAGIHQADLAKIIGKDQSFISNIERGQRRVDVIEFYAIARALNVDPVQLFIEVVAGLPAKVEI
ncbi:helix-turn-helix domain-containing protein [Sphingomonas kyeonggiensis]|uniref:Transcriptional regulator with XRE-family HTH domain n=1 Tax=Sphingomonas kyeonggiensis TaxID=1268553 RepID=A0A7W6JR59_9SPHN|nr:helix-turn-helix transcriptional regulator [Sphingomonas kyeonggiensis]MBB4096976.1 transcriptional regulator with XRE-family HTH domain [Sphingomonas kyeonggiensis]